MFSSNQFRASSLRREELLVESANDWLAAQAVCRTAYPVELPPLTPGGWRLAARARALRARCAAFASWLAARCWPPKRRSRRIYQGDSAAVERGSI